MYPVPSGWLGCYLLCYCDEGRKAVNRRTDSGLSEVAIYFQDFRSAWDVGMNLEDLWDVGGIKVGPGQGDSDFDASLARILSTYELQASTCRWCTIRFQLQRGHVILSEHDQLLQCVRLLIWATKIKRRHVCSQDLQHINEVYECCRTNRVERSGPEFDAIVISMAKL
jgi:hypothetical protein